MPTHTEFKPGDRVRITATGKIGIIDTVYYLAGCAMVNVDSEIKLMYLSEFEYYGHYWKDEPKYYSCNPKSDIHWSQVAPLKPMNISMSFEPVKKEKTVRDVFNTLTEAQKNVVYAMVDEAVAESTRKKKERNEMKFPGIKKVYFNDPATIVLWCDGTKTVVKCSENDWYDPEKGLAMAILKKLWGNDNAYHQLFKKWCPKEEPVDVDGMIGGLFAGLFEGLAKAGYPIAKVDGVKKEGEDTVVECHYEED